MQPLARIRLVLMWLSMCPADESSNEWQKMAYVAHTLAILFFNVIEFIACLIFYLKFVSIDFNGATFAFMTVIGEFGLIYFMITAILMCHRVNSIFTSLSTIYKNHENEESFRYLARASNTSEWMLAIYMKYTAFTLAGVAATSLLSVLYCYLTRGNLNVDLFYRPAYYVLPWDQTTVLGYFGEVGATDLMLYGYMLLNGIPLLLVISLCLHHQAFYEMFKHKIDNLEKYDANMLFDLMRFHISAKDLFLDSANVCSSFVLVHLICNTAVMTVSIFYLDLQSQNFDFTVATAMVATSVGISTLLLYCYFGKMATESYEMMSDCVYNDMKWYEQPTELQKYLVLMIANMQEPIYYHGFGVVNLDLRTFIKLFQKVFSYYMVIKALAAK